MLPALLFMTRELVSMFSKNTYTVINIILLAALFISIMMLSNNFLKHQRIDLTENSLYTVGEGTKNILSSINEKINIYFYFSEKATAEDAYLRNYATRVKEILEEYTLHSQGKLNLQHIDPEPYSSQEDLARKYGLQPIPNNLTGEDMYFGLVGTNATDGTQVIPFFHPDKEPLLEHDLSKFIYSLVNAKKPVIGILSGLMVHGGFDFARKQPTPAWVIIQQIEQLFEMRTVKSTSTVINDDVDVLMIIHPKKLTEETLYAIDQFTLRGGRVFAFVDPYSESDPEFRDASAPPDKGGIQSSNFEKLLKQWGVAVSPNEIIADRHHAMAVTSATQKRPVRHAAILRLGSDAINRTNAITSRLNLITTAFSGHVKKLPNSNIEMTPLLQTSTDTQVFPKQEFRYLPDPTKLLSNFSPLGEKLNLATYLTGKVKSAFPNGLPNQEKNDAHLNESEENIHAIIVADSDLLANYLWVRVQEILGQQVTNPWANNGDFVIHALDSLTGSGDLIGIQSRAGFARPFHLVDTLRIKADETFRMKEQQLQIQLQEAERKLAAIQLQRSDSDSNTLTDAQKDEIKKFQAQKSAIRQELRSVQHELNKDIEKLGTVMKISNIMLMPLIITLFAIILSVLQFRKRNRRLRASAK